MSGEPEVLIFGPYRARLLRACMGFLGTRAAEAGDMVEDTFLVAIPTLQSHVSDPALHTWLRQICLRLCYARLRNSGQNLACLEDDLKSYMRRRGAEPVGSDNLDVQEQQKLGHLSEWIKRLPPDLRLMIELRNVHGFSYKKIGLTLGIPVAMVASKLLNARLRMRESLTNLPNDLPVAA